MIEYYKLKNLNNLLMVAHKSKSYDTRFVGDFSITIICCLKTKNATIFIQDAKLLINRF